MNWIDFFAVAALGALVLFVLSVIVTVYVIEPERERRRRIEELDRRLRKLEGRPPPSDPVSF